MDDYTTLFNILNSLYDEVNGYDFYKDIFPYNESMGKMSKNYTQPNAIYLYEDEKDEGTRRTLRRRIMLNDTWYDDYVNFVENNSMALCSGLSYRGRVNQSGNAQQMNAMIFDLDGVGENEIKNLLMRFGKEVKYRTLPQPTYLVISGDGIHIYYVFKKPIDLYPNIKIQLKSLKYDLTFRIWEYKGTSKKKEIQRQGINQTFRMVGSINNKHGTVLRAFKVGDKIDISYLNQYVIDKKNIVDLDKPFHPSKITREQAKVLYPEWYDRVVVKKIKLPKKWDIKDKVNGPDPYALYHWWIRQLDKIKGGHRYYFFMCMVIYAVKCDVPLSKLKKDMLDIFDEVASITHDNPLILKDIESALEVYSRDFYNFTIDDIVALTDVKIEKNKRNGRKQKDHIKLMNFIRDEINNNKDWRNKNGRPTKKNVVLQYRKDNPAASKAECIRDTKLSKVTVYKYWNDKEIE